VLKAGPSGTTFLKTTLTKKHNLLNLKFNEKDACFITLQTVDSVDIFVRPVYKQVIVHTLNHFIESKGLQVHAWSLMSNHLNLIIRANDGYTLEAIESEYRHFTNCKILEAMDGEPEVRKSWILQRLASGEHKNVWQENANRTSMDLSNINTSLDYFLLVHDKPVKDRCVDLALDYSYSSARDYAGIKGLVNVAKLHEVEQQLAATESINDNYFVKYLRS